MNDAILRESLKACLADSRFPPERQQAVLERIRKEHTVTRKKLSYSLVLAAALLLAFGALAAAAGFGLFGAFSQREDSYQSRTRLERLDQAAQTIGGSASVAAPAPSALPEAQTVHDEILARQSSRTFDLTLNQAYCDGRKLYYSYTLTTNDKRMTFGEGRPSGFDSFEWAEPGKTFGEVWRIDPQETHEEIDRWLSGGPARYVVMDGVAIGDGASIADGSERGTPTIITDGNQTWTDELTLTGFQEVELPEDYAAGDTIDILLSVIYGSTVYYQDKTGVYRQHIAQPENRGILRVPFSVPVTGGAGTLRGTYSADAYTATANLAVSDVSIYGEVVFDAPDWAAAYAAENEYWQSGATGDPPPQPDYITSYSLLAGGEVIKNIGGGYGLNDVGKFHVFLEFDLPASLENLSLQPEGKTHEGEILPLL